MNFCIVIIFVTLIIIYVTLIIFFIIIDNTTIYNKFIIIENKSYFFNIAVKI